jgi:DNA polymerase-3 subunit gamma/tau
VLVEVALVQLTSVPDSAAADDIGPLAARVAALEQALAEGRVPAASPAAPKDPSTGRTALGGRARRAAADATGAVARPEPTPPAAAPAAPTVEPSRSAPAPAAAPAAPAAARDLRAEWEQVRPTLRGIAKPVFAAVDLERTTADTATFAAPNAVHRDKCESVRADVETAWRVATGQPVRIELVVKDEPVQPSAAASPSLPADEDIDLDDLVDAAPGTATTTLDRLAEAFPGSQLVERGD